MCYYKIFIFCGIRKVVILFNLLFNFWGVPPCVLPSAGYAPPFVSCFLITDNAPQLKEILRYEWCTVAMFIVVNCCWCCCCCCCFALRAVFLRTCRHFIELYMNGPLILSTVDLQWMLGNKHGGKVKSLWNVWNFFKFVPFICLVCQRYMD